MTANMCRLSRSSRRRPGRHRGAPRQTRRSPALAFGNEGQKAQPVPESAVPANCGTLAQLRGCPFHSKNRGQGMKKPSTKTPSECPVCGADVPPGARSCPACGADEQSGWNDETTRYDGLDLPAEAFADEDNGASSPRKAGRRDTAARVWRIIAVIVTCAIIYLMMRG